ncbi:hypothetical protein VTK73DRAFT_1103 [Phialemonium thermophilum]|uniref:Amino acid transporter transmembrane domain-containing protein n=1 Tax=Phialemonium thermophilum TaxID=223376 RepID=A0ABR3XAZ3_9PEZI
MTHYSTISEGTSVAESSLREMSRPRRGRSPKNAGGRASMLSSNINLLNTIVGAGTLAMPAALSHFGIVLGVTLIIWCGITSAFGLYLQSRCSRYLDRGTSSFFALSQITYPNAAVLFDAAIAIKCFGVGVSYLIIIGDLMPGVVQGFTSNVDQFPFLDDRNFWITVFMLVIIPLSYLRRLDSLKYTSVVALVSIGYLIILVVYHFAADRHPDRGAIRVITWEGPIAALSNLSVVIFAYTCHQNMFSILNEIQDNSPASVVAVIGASIGSAASIYILVAIAGYLTFGNSVVGNIVSMYPPSVASTIAKAAIVVLVTFSIPLQVHPCRASLDAVLNWRPNKSSKNQTGGSPHSSLSVSQALLPTPNTTSRAQDGHGPVAGPMSDLRFAIITTVILILGYATALTVSSLDRVLAYVGSTGSTAISFILPGLFYYKISDPDSVHHQRLSKEDDDAEIDLSDAESDESSAITTSGLRDSVLSISSVTSGVSGSNNRLFRRVRRKWRWDLEHLETGLLRKLALGLSVYGICVMIISLVMNTFSVVSH